METCKLNCSYCPYGMATTMFPVNVFCPAKKVAIDTKINYEHIEKILDKKTGI